MGSIPVAGAIMGQQFCTLTQKSLIFKGFLFFVKSAFFHHYTFFLPFGFEPATLLNLVEEIEFL